MQGFFFLLSSMYLPLFRHKIHFGQISLTEINIQNKNKFKI